MNDARNDYGVCRSCGKRILWAETTNSKAIPLDPEPAPNGNIQLVGYRAQVVKPAEMLPGTDLYLSHFATCPHAQQHRKAK